MSGLDFLKEIKVDDPATMKSPRSGGGGGVRKQWNPITPNTIRVWKDGSVFPSADLVERFDLEYGPRPLDVAEAGAEPAGEEKKPKWLQSGNAFDVFDSADFPIFKTPQRVLIANVVAKAAGKADLFASIEWDPLTGEPKNSVMDQGANTFGKNELLPLIEDVYQLSPGEKFIDFVLLGKDGESATRHFSLPDGKEVCVVPKKISRGPKKGQMTYARREDPWLFILYPLLTLHPELAQTAPEVKEGNGEAK